MSIELENIDKSYGDNIVYQNFSIKIERGWKVALVGENGAGKSTLMNIIGLLDRPDNGNYMMAGTEVSSLNDNERSGLRNKTIGFIFQSFNLLPRATARRNVMLPLTYRKMVDADRQSAAEKALTRVGLGDRMDHSPTQLSGGERQRVAIARALVGGPSVILADEPTGNLDTRTGAEIMEILHDLSKNGQTVMLVTHDPELAETADRIIVMRDGVLSV
ncbi:MAG: ABC transporter ATP-binding protein [Calditrichaeota bacterium]|nr:ABC transporter ATP-binding protein [Calditrichota bacterium]